jgi:Delta24(24(1))-sterol reductase
VLYAWGMTHEDRKEASGNFVYDTFMGIMKHPRIGRVQLKMMYDIRLPWALVFYVSLSCALKQSREQGYITASSWFMVLAHFLYANATHKVCAAFPWFCTVLS